MVGCGLRCLQGSKIAALSDGLTVRGDARVANNGLRAASEVGGEDRSWSAGRVDGGPSYKRQHQRRALTKENYWRGMVQRGAEELGGRLDEAWAGVVVMRVIAAIAPAILAPGQEQSTRRRASSHRSRRPFLAQVSPVLSLSNSPPLAMSAPSPLHSRSDKTYFRSSLDYVSIHGLPAGARGELHHPGSRNRQLRRTHSRTYTPA